MVDRIGFWAAVALGVVGVLYLVVVGAGVAQAGLSSPIVDPILAWMEILTLLAAPLVVVLMAAVHGHAAAHRKVTSLIAFGFSLIMAGLTSAVHFAALTAGRQMGSFVLEWPSPSYAVELLAWDVFLGLSLLFAAPVFEENGLEANTRNAMYLAGTLCLLGTIGPAVGEMEWQRIGVFGYGVVLPIVGFLTALVFRRDLARVKEGP
jgi:hypothetical protein